MTIRLDHALYRLLYNRAYRRLLLQGRFHDMDLSEQDAWALRTIDTSELEALSEKICRTLLRGDLNIEGGLSKSYPGVFQALKRQQRDALSVMYDFVESEDFARHRQMPHGEAGLCLEEAFYAFLSKNAAFLSAAPYNHLLLTHEFLTVMLSILTVNRDPAFVVQSPKIRHNGAAHYAVEEYPAEIAARLAGREPGKESASKHVLFLYASNEVRLVRGPTEPVVIALLTAGSRQMITRDLPLLASRFTIDPAHIDRMADNLHQLGLLG